MVNKSFTARVESVERRRGIGAEPEPTLFVSIYDARRPASDPLSDPCDGSPIADYSDEAIIGVEPSRQGPVIPRLPRESIKAMEKRAGRVMPDCRVFFMVYANASP